MMYSLQGCKNNQLYRTSIIIVVLGLLMGSCASLRKNSRKVKIKKILAAASSYRGVPYQYGGNNRSGIDCSGLVCRSYESVGIHLPRTAKKQVLKGKKIRRKKRLHPGDLVFFATGKSRRKITHVGIVAKTEKRKKNATFIHASTSSGVTLSELSNSYFKKKYRTARRIIR